MLDSSTSIQWLGADILTTLVFLPSLGALVLLFLSNEAKNAIRAVGLLASGATFAVSVAVLQKFNPADRRDGGLPAPPRRPALDPALRDPLPARGSTGSRSSSSS